MQGVRDGGLNLARQPTSRPARTGNENDFLSGAIRIFGLPNVASRSGDLNARHLAWTSNPFRDHRGDFDNRIRGVGADAVGCAGEASLRRAEAGGDPFPARRLLP